MSLSAEYLKSSGIHVSGTDPQIKSDELVKLLGISGQAVRANCAEGRYNNARKDSAGAWLIPLSSLPPLAQALYWVEHADIALDDWAPDERRELSDEDAEILWKRLESASVKLKGKAQRDEEACHLWWQLRAQGTSIVDALLEIKAQYGLGKSALYEKLSRIKGYAPLHWRALLLGQWTGENAKRTEWHPAAWAFFLRQALSPGRKKKTAWRSTKREAEAKGWDGVPGYDTAKKDFDRLPRDVVTLAKEGETALKVMSPKLIRKYDLAVHDTWSLDARRIDLMARDVSGKYGPAGRVFRLYLSIYMDVRSRMILGYAFSGTLNADLTRAAFIEAIKTTGNLIPRKVAPDNGMENAAKEISGGASWRRRGKVKEDEIIGLFPMLSIEVVWATVAHGQAKPVERLFGTLGKMHETRDEFKGAFCGNTPEARPEEWDIAKAVPLELVEKLFAEEVAAYHRTPHRGNGMEGKSPLQVYAEHLNADGSKARRISKAQARLCTYSAQEITIRKDGSFTIFGASYRSDATAALASGCGYYVRYNPLNLSDTVYVYRHEKLLCQAQRIELTSFNDKAAGKRIMRERANWTKAVKQKDKALRAIANSESQEYLARLADRIVPEVIDPGTGEILPGSKVMELVRAKVDTLPDQKTEVATEGAVLAKEAKRLQDLEGREAADRIRKRASGGF